MPKIDPFEKYTVQYDYWFIKNKYIYQSEINAVRKVIPENSCGFEIGIGTGRFAIPFGIKKGVDPSYKMRNMAIKNGLDVLDGTAECLPYKDAQFDFALMVTTICFVDDVEKSFCEASRVLKPKGKIIIGFVDKNSPVGKMYFKKRNDSLFYKEAVFYSVDEVVFYLKKTGFSNFVFYQTIFRNLKDIKEIEPVKKGYGKGSFIVILAEKK